MSQPNDDQDEPADSPHERRFAPWMVLAVIFLTVMGVYGVWLLGAPSAVR